MRGKVVIISWHAIVKYNYNHGIICGTNEKIVVLHDKMAFALNTSPHPLSILRQV